MPAMVGAAWMGDLIKRYLAEENKYFGGYRHVDVKIFSKIHILPYMLLLA